VHSQVPCNQDYYDDDADDVENVHWALEGMRDFNLKRGASRRNALAERKFHVFSAITT
jgi:hypothetical protein